jgi:hypothetical protein
MSIPKRLSLMALLALTFACGGGGGGGGTSTPASPALSMSVSPTQLSVTAAYSDLAPTGTVTVTLSQAPANTVYLSAKAARNTITNVTIASTTATAAVLSVQFAPPSALGLGTWTDTLSIGVYSDQALTQPIGNSPQSVATTYTVTSLPAPTVSALSPSSTGAGSPDFTLTVTGSHFLTGSVVQWNGSPRPTAYVSSTQLTAQISANDVASAGSFPVSVDNGTTGGGVSAGVAFTVQPPVFGLLSVTPTTVNAGGPAFTLSVRGALFVASSAVQWNGSARPTTFVSSTQLTAQISPADIAASGTAQVTVLNPAGQGGTSNALPVSVVPPEAVSFQINPAHTGAISFGSATLPGAKAWSVTLDGPPSYALIAGGKVFVTVPITGGTEILALDQVTGSKVWGPILVAGTGNAAYENGTLFVLYTPALGSGGILQAFDGGTGASKWSAMLPGQYMLDAAPTAANGMVYVTESGSGVTLYAYNQGNGNLAWSQSLMAGDNCAPAVTPTGVYVTYPQIAASFDPLTGAQNWIKLDGGDGGGGAIPVVANGLMYAPNGFGTYNGQILDASTGILKGTYAADMPPAIGAQIGCFLQGGTLRGLDLATNTILWSFAGDGQLCTSPILVNNFVFIGSASGTLFGLDLASGSQLWQQALGAPMPYGANWGHSIPLSGLSAGNGIVVAPAGNTLTAFALQ